MKLINKISIFFIMLFLFSSISLANWNRPLSIFNNITNIPASNVFTGTFPSANYSFINDASIKLYADEHNVFGEDNGESIELHGLQPTSKPYIGWYGYDNFLGQDAPIGWIGCHYNLSNGDVHSHCSWETLDNTTGAPRVNTHFEISYNASQLRARVKFPQSDVQYLTNQRVFFGDNLNSVWMNHNSTTGDFDLKTNADVNLQCAQLDLNGADITEVDDIFSINGGSVAFKADTTVDSFANGQTTRAFRIGDNGNTFIQVTGDTQLEILEEVRISDLNTGGNTGTDLCADANGYLCLCGQCA